MTHFGHDLSDLSGAFRVANTQLNSLEKRKIRPNRSAFGRMKESKKMCSTCDFVTVVEEFLQSLQARGLRDATVTTRRGGLLRFGEFLVSAGVTRVQDITADTLRGFGRWLTEGGRSENSVYSYLYSVRSFLGWLEDRGELFENPARRFPMPKKSLRLPRVPSKAKVRKLISAVDALSVCGIRDRAILEMLYGTGIRLEELCRLDVADVDLTACTLRVDGKGGRERVLPMGNACCEHLSNYLQQARPVLAATVPEECSALWLASRCGPRLSKQSVELALRRQSRKARLKPPITPHDLRRAMATHMLQNGANPLHIQFLLGHASLRHLGQYLRLSIDDIKAMHAKSKPGS